MRIKRFFSSAPDEMEGTREKKIKGEKSVKGINEFRVKNIIERKKKERNVELEEERKKIFSA